MNDRAVLFLSVAAFASAASLRATDPLLALLAAEFGVTPGAAAAVITGFAVANGLLQIVNGPIGDRVGKYRMVVFMCALSAAGTLVCAFAPTFGEEYLIPDRELTFPRTAGKLSACGCARFPPTTQRSWQSSFITAPSEATNPKPSV